MSCLLLVALTFAATGWIMLSPLLISVGLAVWLTAPGAGSIWRVCWMLRWLLLFTLLMHLLLSSGRTLWGVSWLSLDGLMMGFFVCVQMLMAIVISALLAITTSTASLSGAFGWFVQPLQWLGCKTEEWQKILLLTMDFIPVVHEEIHACSVPDLASHSESTSRDGSGRWSKWRQALLGILLRLMDRGELIAQRIAGGEELRDLPAGLSPLMPLTLQDQLFSLAITLVVVCYWFTG